jgi:hypothetical protein
MSDDFRYRPLFGSSEEERATFGVPGVAQPRSQGLLGRAASGLGTAVRFAGGAFEPLLLPQDAMFSLLAGARDANRSPVDYWREMEWSKYAPFGATPERVASGADLLRLYGVENEDAQQWGGIALDLVADPLLVGAWMSGLGRVTRAAGMGDDLLQLGRRIDDSLSLIPITRGGKTRSIVQNRVTRSMIPAPLRESIATRTQEAFTALIDLPFIKAGREALSPLTPRRPVLQQRFGREAGTELQRGESMAQSVGGEIREHVQEQFQEINDLLGVNAGNWFGNILEAVGLRSRAGRQVAKFRTGTQTTILRQAQRLSDNHGALLFNEFPTDVARIAGGTSFEPVRQLRGQLAGATELLSQERRAAASQDLTAAVQRVRRAAQNSGDKLQDAEDAFRRTLAIVTESDALVGFHLSMYQPVQQAFAETVGTRLAQNNVSRESATSFAGRLWQEVMGEGINGRNIDDITEVAGQSIENLLGTRTLGEFLNQDRFFSRLKLSDFVTALGEGHMRRTFGVMGEMSMPRYMDAIDPEKGPIRLIPSTVVDEQMIESVIQGRPGQLVRELFDDVKPIALQGLENMGRKVPGMGTVVPTNVIIRHLMDNNIPQRQAQEAVDALIGRVSGSQAYTEFVAKAREAMTKYRSVNPARRLLSNESMGPGARGTDVALRERVTMEEEYLEILGEIANPLISLDEASKLAERTLPTDTYLRQLYEFAEREGLVSTTYRTGLSPLGISPDDAPAVFEFAGKYVHPYIEKEIKRAVRRSEFRTPNWLNRISQYIRGSLLAGPNIITANLGGGIYTASLVGVNPMTMMGEIPGVLRDAARAAVDPDFDFADYNRLRTIIPLDLSRMSDASFVERGARRLQREYSGMSQQGVQPFLDATADLMRTFVDNPAEAILGAGRRTAQVGQRTTGDIAGAYARRTGAAFGLQGFAASEGIMKMAAFRSALKQGFTEMEAAEIARLSTFDYSELPDLLASARDFGVLMFPGFSYFIAGRTLTGALRKPGVTAAWNRVPEAIMNAQDIPEEDRYALYSAMPEWLKNDIGTPIRTRTGPNGEAIYSVAPLNQFLPINTWTVDNLLQPFGQSLATLGIYQPFIELMYAAVNGSGDAPFSARYGQRVFEPGRPAGQQALQSLGFMYNNLAPNALRKIAGSYSAGSGFAGIAPSLWDKSLVDMPPEIARLGYDAATLRSGRVVRDLTDNVISSAFRSIQPVSLGGRYPTMERTFNQAAFQHNEELNTLEEEYNRARVRGDQAAMERVREQVRQLNMEFREKWQPMIRASQRTR